jgi:hypothetical protein
VEQITTSVVSGVALPFLVLKAPSAGAILLAPLRGIKAISAVLVSRSKERLGSAKKPRILPNLFSIKRVITQILDLAGAQWRSGCAGPTPTTRTQADPSNAANLPTRGEAGRMIANDRQALLERIDLLERKLADAHISVSHETDWVPLVKTAFASGTEPTARTAMGRATCNEKRATLEGNFDLAARKVLCVGGKAALYPEYRRVVEASGATLFFYRSDPRPTSPTSGHGLPKLLSQVDMVVCPIDCVNHEAYFTAKRYCKYYGKPYVLLDRSDIPTFRKGVATLAGLAAAQAGPEPTIPSTEPSSPG